MLQVRARLKEDIKKVCRCGISAALHIKHMQHARICSEVLRVQAHHSLVRSTLQAQDLVERLTDPEKGKDQPHPVRSICYADADRLPPIFFLRAAHLPFAGMAAT
jgi:hypothetical protein